MGKKRRKRKIFEKYYCCPHCRRAICGEIKKYFVCPECGRALCPEEDIPGFKQNYCGNCGHKLSDAIRKALASDTEED